MAEPQAWHRVEAATDDVEWYLEFYCEPKDYFPKIQHQSCPFRSARSSGIVPAGRALDLGCERDATPSFGPTWL